MRAVLAFFFLLLATTLALAEERIENFVSDVTVNVDGSLDVRETITVRAEGNAIKRGILRDFPTTYRDRLGNRVRAGFEVLSVRRDGRNEPYALESLSNGKRIRIGTADVFLDQGSHTYEISYRTTRQLGFFGDFDELYWNVTGNGWTFPIDLATTIIRLPRGAEIKQSSAYTGVQGAQGQDFRVLSSSGSDYRAETTRPLSPGEGFTVAVSWQKGIVTAPTASDRFTAWLWDNAGLFLMGLTVLVAVGYYVYAWNKVGRDPPKGTIIPLFTPPAGLSPGAARFIWQQKFDDRTFAAALVGLAVKGRLHITDSDGDFTIEKRPNGGPALSSAEAALYSALSGGKIRLEKSNHVMVRAIRSALEGALRQEYEGSVFLRNLGWFWTGAAISAAGLVLAALFLPGDESFAGLFAAGWAAIWWGVILTVIWGAIGRARTQHGFFNKLGSVATLLFMIPFVFGGVAVPAAIFLGEGGSPGLYLIILTAIVLAVMNLIFFHLLRAPTIPGRKLLDELEGFRMYLATAEEERLKVLHPPDKTPALFEKYLPYALALDCENEWNAKFAAVLAAAAVAGAAAPLWYSGSNWNSGNLDDFTGSLGSSLSSTISSASTAPGTSSGSGGGGSSGGGGGGGGGSGW